MFEEHYVLIARCGDELKIAYVDPISHELNELVKHNVDISNNPHYKSRRMIIGLRNPIFLSVTIKQDAKNPIKLLYSVKEDEVSFIGNQNGSLGFKVHGMSIYDRLVELQKPATTFLGIMSKDLIQNNKIFIDNIFPNHKPSAWYYNDNFEDYLFLQIGQMLYVYDKTKISESVLNLK